MPIFHHPSSQLTLASLRKLVNLRKLVGVNLRKLTSSSLALALIAGLIAQPALAAAPSQTASGPEDTSYHVSCRDGVCTVALDLGEIDLETVVPAGAPVKLDLPAGAVPFLNSGSIEISDSITVSLPMGSVNFRNGDFSLHLDKDGKLDRLHVNSDSVTPQLNLGPNIKLGGPFAAQIGYDYGSTLDGLGTVLDPDRLYLFFHLGGGLTLDATIPGSSQGSEPVRFTIPEGDRISLVIDPDRSLVYVDGQVTLNQLTDLGLALGLLGMTPASIPLLSGVVLPTRTTIGVGALLSPDMSQNFLQLSGGMGINGGPLGKLLRIEGETLGFDGMLRVDSNGLLLGGVAKSAVNPDQVLDSRGELSVFIPFSGNELPYVQVGGSVRVPAIGIEAEVARQIGGGAISEDESTNAMLESTAQAARDWWNQTGSWMSGLASSLSDGSRKTLNAVQSAADKTSDAISGGAKTIWNSAGAGAGMAWEGAGAAVNAGAAGAAAAWDGTAAAASCAAQQAQQLWCRTTGMCEVQEVVCE